jgi:hypothetical protein
MSNKVTVVKNGNFHTLHKDGSECFCPKSQPMPVQTQLGATSWARFPCNTACPFANIVEIDDKKFYKIKCEGADVSYQLQESKEEKKFTSSLIIGEA